VTSSDSVIRLLEGRNLRRGDWVGSNDVLHLSDEGGGLSLRRTGKSAGSEDRCQETILSAAVRDGLRVAGSDAFERLLKQSLVRLAPPERKLPMINPETSPHLPPDFSGQVRLFPLPNLVMFPHVVQPLHIFEPRYRAMLEDALAADHLIAMALLDPGKSQLEQHGPPIHPTICIGRVVAHAKQKEGTYNLALLGLQRAQFVRELPREKPYRMAEVVVQEDLYLEEPEASLQGLQAELVAGFQRLIAGSVSNPQEFQALLGADVPLGVLTDIIGFTIDFPIRFKQALLSENRVTERASMLREALERVQLASSPPATNAKRPPYPPRFSEN
jgi:Lon protease-like protein